MTIGLRGRVVVVSPHLDDAVFSLGGTMARAAAAGADVVSLTVFGCDPASTAPANGWDTRGGFRTEGEAATARRQEDFEACKQLGVRPLWLAFRGGGYSPHKDVDAVAAALQHHLKDADAVLIPGFPLANDDHGWLAKLFEEHALGAGRIGRYVEQPYAYTSRRQRRSHGVWVKVPLRVGDRLRKRRAMKAYATQLPLLSLGVRELTSLAIQHELISWNLK